MIDSVDLEMRNLWGSSVVMWALRSGELAVVEGAVTMEKGSEQCRTAGFDDGGRGREPRDVGASRSWKTEGNGTPPRASRKSSRSPPRHLAPITVR